MIILESRLALFLGVEEGCDEVLLASDFLLFWPYIDALFQHCYFSDLLYVNDSLVICSAAVEVASAVKCVQPIVTFVYLSVYMCVFSAFA